MLALWRGGEIGWPAAAFRARCTLDELRSIRRQVLALAGHKPDRRDALPPFQELFPLLAEALGLAGPDANARAIVGTLEALAASTRVDAP